MVQIGARSVVLIRRRFKVSIKKFAHFINDVLGPSLASVNIIGELRTQVFVPWSKALWDTPHVAHDYPEECQFHAMLVIGAKDEVSLEQALESEALTRTIQGQRMYCAAIHAYKVQNTIHIVGMVVQLCLRFAMSLSRLCSL
jgi:hypothetical protein